jgi:hypothetical protein
MNLGANPSDNKKDAAGSVQPSSALLSLLKDELQKTEEFYGSISTEYDETVYTQLEDRFNDLRQRFKNKSQVISDEDYEYIIRSEMRRTAMGKIITSATEVAGRFQDARKTNSLDRPACKDALENLMNALKSFKHLIEEQR